MLNINFKMTGVIFLATAVLFTGCAAGNATDKKQSASSSTTQTAGDSTNGSTDTQSQKPKFKRPDLIGEISSIIGNSVTLKLAKMPTNNNGNSSNGESTSGSNAGGPPSGGEMPPGGAPPSGGQGNGSTGKTSGSGSNSGNGGFGNSGTRSSNFSLTYTGETKEIMIPVGVSITSGRGTNAKSLDIADLKKGNIIMIYYSEGTEDIESVSVR